MKILIIIKKRKLIAKLDHLIKFVNFNYFLKSFFLKRQYFFILFKLY